MVRGPGRTPSPIVLHLILAASSGALGCVQSESRTLVGVDGTGTGAADSETVADVGAATAPGLGDAGEVGGEGGGPPCSPVEVDGVVGLSCAGNDDCNGGVCINGLCSRECLDSCPCGWTCTGTGTPGGEVNFVCVSGESTQCAACEDDAACGGVAACGPRGPDACPEDCAPACGDCVCEPGEGWLSCPVDCGYCGDGVCSPCSALRERVETCPADCCVPGQPGCGEPVDPPCNPSTDPECDDPPPEDGRCVAELRPSSLDFGVVPPGQARSFRVSLVNTGDGPCLIPADRPWHFLHGCSLGAGVELRPNIRARVGTSVARALPGGVDFGRVGAGCTTDVMHVTLYVDPPIGSEDLTRPTFTLSSVELANGCADGFILESAPLVGPDGLRVDVDSPVMVRMLFDAESYDDAVTVDCQLLFLSADVETPPVTVPLQARITAQRTVTTSHVLPAARPVDVLLVMDTSGSTESLHRRIAEPIRDFVQAGVDRGADFRFAVTTMDLDAEPGALVGVPRWITQESPAGPSAVESRVEALGDAGSGFEMGLQAWVTALDTNADFRRSDADFEVIAVSNEEDQSHPPTSFFVQLLDEIARIANGQARMHAIVGKSDECNPAISTVDAGLRYIDVAEQSGGRVEDFCTEDYGPVLARLVDQVFGARTAFRLDGAPELAEPMTVKVDNTECTGGWIWAPDRSSVVFDPADACRPRQGGSVVTITWSPSCSNL